MRESPSGDSGVGVGAKFVDVVNKEMSMVNRSTKKKKDFSVEECRNQFRPAF